MLNQFGFADSDAEFHSKNVEGIMEQGLSHNASSVSFGHAEHCFLTVWTPKSLCQNLLKMTFLRR